MSRFGVISLLVTFALLQEDRSPTVLCHSSVPGPGEAGFSRSDYCKSACQWGRGGNLCNCNAAYFAGKKRSLPATGGRARNTPDRLDRPISGDFLDALKSFAAARYCRLQRRQATRTAVKQRRMTARNHDAGQRRKYVDICAQPQRRHRTHARQLRPHI